MAERKFETTVLGGFPVIVYYEVQPRDPDVGILSAFVDGWRAETLHGHDASFVTKRMTKEDVERLEGECMEHALEPPIGWGG